MGGELVNSPAPSFSYTEVFEQHFPYYLAMGMTYEQFWYKDCKLVEYYRKADEIRAERKNQELWLQGMYIYDALCRVSPILHAFAKNGTRPEDYPDKPYPISERKAEQERMEREKANRAKARAVFEAWAANLNLPKKKDGE